MLQEHAWKERVMLEAMRIEDERKERLRQMREKEMEEAEAKRQKEVVDAKVEPKKEMNHAEVEQKKQRKDSLVVGMKDVEYANKEGVGENVAASAICDSSEEEEEEVQPQQIKDVKGRKASLDKGRKVRKVKPLGCMRKSCASLKTPTA
jgi:hypothetical protein